MPLDINPKELANKINQCLDEADAPTLERKRVEILADMLNISKFDAKSLLSSGTLPPLREAETLEEIALQFEVEIDWLMGKKPHPHSPSR